MAESTRRVCAENLQIFASIGKSFSLSHHHGNVQAHAYADVKIGSINIPHITVADDLAVMSRKYSSQQIKIWDVENNTQRERYCVNPSKSSTLVYPYAKSNDIECTSIFMADDTISNDSKTTHLGIHREVNDKPNIEEKINIGRKTAYSIMGAGFHSGNGLKVCLNGYLWSAFVVPRITYGLEVLSLRKKDIEIRTGTIYRYIDASRYGLGRYAYRYAWCRIAILLEIRLSINLAHFLPQIKF